MATIVPGKNKDKPYTVRFRDNGRQKERSFVTKREANDFKAKFEYESREQIFVDPKGTAIKFREAAEKWVVRKYARTQRTYRAMLNNHINPAIGDLSIQQVSRYRDTVAEFLLDTMPANGQGPASQAQAYIIIKGVLNEQVRAGRLAKHLLNGIELPTAQAKADFVFPTFDQLTGMAESMGYLGNLIWLMRGCGLRIGEALAVRYEDFVQDGFVLRVTRQCDVKGDLIPLKARKHGDFRDIPVPAYVYRAVFQGESDRVGSLFPRRNRKTVTDAFQRARDSVAIEGHFTPHSLRHVFASVSLSNGIPITDVSHWLGHKDINTTFSIYGHLVPSSFEKARYALDVEYGKWANPAREAA